jgi:hypothetical protein
MQLIDRIERPGPKQLLAIDGGGIRGVLALEMLQRIEDLLKAKSGRPDFRLADYFDHIAGTSTGGIIAAGLSIGMSVGEILAFYQEAGAQMFVKANLLRRLRYKFEDEPLAAKLREVFTADTTLGSEKLQTLLLLVMRNATTDSPWPISNNPYARYNDRTRNDCNLSLPLWQLIRASTAAPTYFPPEVVMLGTGNGREFVFVDGGVTMYNNPAFQMFLMATLDRYWTAKPEARWRTGTGRMLIVSVGTGTSPAARQGLDPERDEPAVQRVNDPLCLDVRRPERAGSALPGVWRVPRWRPPRPGVGRPYGQHRAAATGTEALHLPALQRRADP